MIIVMLFEQARKFGYNGAICCNYYPRMHCMDTRHGTHHLHAHDIVYAYNYNAT